MRPIAVLLLVIGAIAALVFALSSIMGGDDGGTTNVVQPAVTSVATDITKDVVMDRMAPALNAPEEETRVAVDVASDVVGAIDSFLGGVVVGGIDEAVVPGATVQLVRHRGNATFAALQRLLNDQPAPKPLKETTTDAKGQFRFDRVQPGRDWGLVVVHEEYARALVGPILVTKDKGAIEKVRLHPGFEVFGVVLDDGTGGPLEGALIVLDSPAAAFLPSTRKSPDRLETLSTADGSFSIRNVPLESRTLIVSREGYATQIDQRAAEPPRGMNRRTREDQSNRRLEIRMKAGRVMAGRVIQPDGRGVEGVEITALGNSTSKVSRGIGVSKADGEFLIADIGEGRYTLSITASGYDCEPLQAEAGDRNVIIELKPQGGIRGVVLKPDGTPLRSYHLIVRQEHPTSKAFGAERSKQNVKNSRDGSFFVSGIKAGTYFVQADCRGFASSFSDPVVVQEGQNTPDVVVRMSAGGTLTGQVVDMKTGEPVPGVKIRTNTTGWIDSDFTNFLGALAPSAITKVEGITNKEGRFEIKLVTPEAYQLRFSCRGYTDAIMNDVAAVADLVTDVGLVAISRGATIHGTAYQSSGEPAGGVDVMLSPIGDQPRFSGGKAQADSEGHFVLSNVAAGRYKISCSSRPQPGASPLVAVADMQRSAVEIEVFDGDEFTQDLYMGQK
jgi:5-hydroxyisourate hydrolase-like protein (transthyretin family)